MTLRTCPTARTPMGQRPAPLVTMLFGIGLLAGCVTTGGNGGNNDPTSLTLATGFTIDDLDPLENGIWGPEFGYVELLMHPERDAEPSPWILSDLANPDPHTWELTLHKDIEFGNGTPLDADALADLLTYQLAENDDFAAALPDANATVSGTRRVTLTTKDPAPNVPNLLADEAMVPVYDVAAYRKHRKAETDPSELVDAGIYTGPYEVERLDSKAMELSANEDYWDGTPALEEVTVRFVPEESARIQAVQNGEADIALYPPVDSAPTLEDRDDSFYVTGEPVSPAFMLELNHRQEPFDDPRVRRAVYAGVDYTALADDVMNGNYEPAIGLYTQHQPWAARTQQTDLDKARSLLDDAGWTTNGDGVRTHDGSPLSFTMLTYPQQPDSRTLAVAVQSQLQKLGIKVEIEQVPDIDSAMADDPHDWDAAVRGNGFISFGGDYITPLVNYLHSAGPSNLAGTSDQTLDTLIDKVEVEFDTDNRNKLLQQIQHRVEEMGHLGYLGIRLPPVVTSPEWQNYSVPVSNLWVDAETAPDS